MEDDAGIETIGGIHAPAGEVAAARECLLEALERRAAEHPENPEITVAESRTATGLRPGSPTPCSPMHIKAVRVTDTGVSLPNEGVPVELEREAAELLEELRSTGSQPRQSSPRRRCACSSNAGMRSNWEARSSPREAAESVLEHIKTICRERGEISLAELRDSLGTSRKYAQAWLEYSDAAGVTSRTGDVRVSPAATGRRCNRICPQNPVTPKATMRSESID